MPKNITHRQATELMDKMSMQISRTRQVAYFVRNITRSSQALRSQSSLAPIFIIGSGRSGNTLIRRVLMASAQVYIPPETYVLGKIIQNFERLRFLPWQIQVHIALGNIVSSQDFKYFPECDYHRIASNLKKVPRAKRTCADLLDTFYREWANSAGYSGVRWGDKTPMNAFCLDEIKHTFPEAQFIYVQRALHDVVASYLKMGRYNTVQEATQRWLAANYKCILFRDQNLEKTLTVRYNNLVSQPNEYFPLIFDFLEFGFRKEVLDMPSHGLRMGDDGYAHFTKLNRKISADSVNQGKASLSEKSLNEINFILKSSRLPQELHDLT